MGKVDLKIVACVALAALGAAGCANDRLVPRAPVAARTCADITFPVYFSENSDQLTDVARQALTLSARQVHGCHIGYVSVVGLASATGAAEDNLELSKKRADVVAAALQAEGLPAPKFEVRALGETGAITPHGHEAPMRRRADVTIHASAS